MTCRAPIHRMTSCSLNEPFLAIVETSRALFDRADAKESFVSICADDGGTFETEKWSALLRSRAQNAAAATNNCRPILRISIPYRGAGVSSSSLQFAHSHTLTT